VTFITARFRLDFWHVGTNSSMDARRAALDRREGGAAAKPSSASRKAASVEVTFGG